MPSDRAELRNVIPFPKRQDNDTQSHVGLLLRRMWASAVQEPVPERFLDLLKVLEAQPGSARGFGGGETQSRR
ncbi:hypothetical protein SLNSH_09265 [Alsobacter soli]|uniref:Anti-sigma factor NepR domain-containing protein n=1 Tax=Alsobacter soli TaxID=2109933 RepID=A0A2T1HUN4_9HYPH|nr:NepR family anti-sigma factor [Alsobacter soli]PSC05376.1 hypothetical protein SLNSH_09265 [Alsobacter soli]